MCSLFLFLKPDLFQILYKNLHRMLIMEIGHSCISNQIQLKPQVMKLLFDTPYFIKNGLLLLGVLFLLSCKSENSKPKEIVMNYGTGEISRRYTEINHKKEGLMTDYYPDGKLKGERMFKNDVQVGKTTFYYESGKIKQVQYYVDGKVEGGDTTYYKNGKPQLVINYSNGEKNGYLRKWNENDSLIFEAKYANEKLVEVKGEDINPDSIPHQVIYTQGPKVKYKVN